MVEIKEVPMGEGDPGAGGDGSELRQRNVTQDDDGQVAETEEAEQNGPELSFDEQVDRARAQFQPTRMEKFLAIAKSMILRALIIYFIMSFLRGNGTPSKAPASGSSSGDGTNSPAANSHVSTNIYPNGTVFDMYVYLSDDKDEIRNFTNAKLLWKQERLVYGDWYGGEAGDGTIVQSVNILVPEAVQNNGSFYLHSYMVPVGLSPDPSNKQIYSRSESIHAVKMLNKFKKKRYAKTKNLITGETSATVEEQEKAKSMASEIVSHWHPNITVCFVTDWTAWTPGAVPAPLNEVIEFVPLELKYKPVAFFNDYWNLLKDYQPINQTVKEITVTITYQPISLFKWQIYASQSMRNQWQNSFLTGEEDEDDQDTLKEAILETNPYLLALTFAVSILHSIFEFLAFKNDIQFWNNRQSLEGLSVRSVFFGVFQSLIVLLYVLDNDTNFVIRMSVFVGLAIEIWKINKVVDFSINREERFLGIFPKLKFTDKGSYVESSTRQYDMLAFRYLSWLLFPLLIGYSVYSLLYVEQKGWYSWVLNMLYGFLLTFGFIMMTPQLFINYKLKSVAHLPWRMLSYKFLNTFIDDIFAFVIKMPTMYRIGCLRDDVIFFIFLYQRYIYRIDPTRLNEFGFSAEMLDQKKKEIESSPPAAAVNGEIKTSPTASTTPAAAASKSKSSKKSD